MMMMRTACSLLEYRTCNIHEQYSQIFYERVQNDKQKTEINKITEKFREIKSLVYEYKNDKEKEISNLSENQSKLINELEDHKINYESLVDRATSEIENFIKKHDTDIQVQ